MFAIDVKDNGEIVLIGRFDAAQVERADAVFDAVTGTRVVSFERLDYISSAGLGVLLKTQKRLSDTGHQLLLRNMNKLIRDIFRIARFDLVFQIDEEAPPSVRLK